MSEASQPLYSLIRQRVNSVLTGYRSRRTLRVAVLGPALNNDGSVGGHKRRQIYDALRNDGHAPFFPEDLPEVDPVEPRDLLLEQEKRVLNQDDVGLVIILHYENSIGAIMEIANFVSSPEIKAKTAILFPMKHYKPDYNLPANTIRAFRDKMIYSESQIASCDLVGECRKWAHDRAAGQWPDPIPHSV